MADTAESKLLQKLMDEAGMTPTELGEKAGYGRGSTAYLRVYPYLTGKRPMGPKVRKTLAKALDLPEDTFDNPRGSAAKMALAKMVYEAFIKTEDGSAAHPYELAGIRRILPTMHNPNVNTLKALLFALRGQGPMPSEQDDELNKMLDQANEAKRPKKKG